MSPEWNSAKANPAPRPTLDEAIPLRFGRTRLSLRPLEPGDLGALVDFFAAQVRTVAAPPAADPFSQLGPDLAGRLIDLDQERDFFVGVFDASGAPLVAVGGYFLLPSGAAGEVRMLVAHEFRRLGLATAIMRVLAAIARRRGLGCLIAHARRDNDAIRAVFGRLNATLSRPDAAGIVQLTLPVVGFDDLRLGATDRTTPQRSSLAAAVRRARIRLQDAVLRMPPTFPLP